MGADTNMSHFTLNIIPEYIMSILAVDRNQNHGKVLTSLDCSSLEYTLLIGSEFFLLLLFVLFVSFLFGGGLRPRALPPRRPTPLVSSSAANANKSVYCFY